MKLTIAICRLVLRLSIAVLVGMVELGCWLILGARKTLSVLVDLRRAGAVLPGHELHCPEGHIVPTEGVFECQACGYRYAGSVWLCPNVECPSPVTSYTNCVVCGLSVRSPMRIGKP